VSAAIIGAVYALVYTGVRNFLLQIGKERLAANKERFLLAQEATGGIKQVKVMGLEGEYIRRFRKSALSFAKHQVSSATIGLLPRYVLELVIFGGMLFLIMLLLVVRGEGNFEAILPLLGVFAVAGYRLLPALQQIFQSLTKLRFHRPALDRIFDDLAANGRSEISIPNVSISQRLGLRESLELTDVAFTYPHAVRPALQHVTITIPANTTLGLVGPTGAGKSTFVDLVLGLLQAQHGLVHVDGVPITKTNVRAWQRSIGYVPQRIFLTDDTVARNIAFGVPEAKIDMDAVKDAAQIADLHTFISGELPDGYQSMIGECGVRLSGGQRQRLGIARALYHTPDVLVLDEATSSLDNITERSVMDAIHNLGHKKTIILVAHRLTTVKLCDQILLFEDGRISASGTYDQLLRASRSFHAMAEMST